MGFSSVPPCDNPTVTFPGAAGALVGQGSALAPLHPVRGPLWLQSCFRFVFPPPHNRRTLKSRILGESCSVQDKG